MEVNTSPGTSSSPKSGAGRSTVGNTPIEHTMGKSSKPAGSSSNNEIASRGSGTKKKRASANTSDDREEVGGKHTMNEGEKYISVNEIKSPLAKKKQAGKEQAEKERSGGRSAMMTETSALSLGGQGDSAHEQAHVQQKRTEGSEIMSDSTNIPEKRVTEEEDTPFSAMETQGGATGNGAQSIESPLKMECPYQENEEQRRRRIRLCNILSSIEVIPINQKTASDMTQTPAITGTVKESGQVVVADYNMIAGDGQEDHGTSLLKPLQSQIHNAVSKGDQQDASQLGALPTTRNLEAGGDAGMVPAVQHCATVESQDTRNTAPEYREKPPPLVIGPEAHLIINAPEKLAKETTSGIHGGELIYTTDLKVIHLNPVVAIGQENEAAAQSSLNISTLPIIVPEASLLYQPEVGVMKSRPVPKPTRGRRSKRRSAFTSLPGSSGYRPYVPPSEVHNPDHASVHMPRHSYSKYLMPENVPGMSSHYYNEAANAGSGTDFIPYPVLHSSGRDVIGNSGEGMSPAFATGNKWYCHDNYQFKRGPLLYGPVGFQGRGHGRGVVTKGRPRGSRGPGGVRQYLQHRLLWARYTGRSQEALDRVLSVINNRMHPGAQVAPKGNGITAPPHTAGSSHHSELWAVGERPAADALTGSSDEDYYGHLADTQGSFHHLDHPSATGLVPPGHYSTSSVLKEPARSAAYSYFNPNPARNGTAAASFPIANSDGDSSSSSSSLVGPNIASNAVVDGNGFIMYPNHDPNTQYQQQAPITFLTSDAPLTAQEDRGDIDTNTVTGNGIRKAKMAPSQPTYVGVNPPGVASKLVPQDMPPNANQTDVGMTGEASGPVAAMPLEQSLTDHFPPEKEKGKRATGRKRITPKTAEVKTPVSPMKELRAPKKQACVGRPKKRVRRSLTFPSPVKQDETLRATETIAKVLKDSSPSNMAQTPCSSNRGKNKQGKPGATSLNTITNALTNSNTAAVSINIRLQGNKERERSSSKAEDIAAAKRAIAPSPVANRQEGSELAHFPVPRYMVEWHGHGGDYYAQGAPGDAEGPPPHFQARHTMPPVVSSHASSRYGTYRGLNNNNSHSYYPGQHTFSGPGPSMDPYYNADYARGEWDPNGPYAHYSSQPSHHYMPAYDTTPHHLGAGSAYPVMQWNAPDWNRAPPEMYLESYQTAPGHPGRAPAGMDMQGDKRDDPYAHYHTATPVSYARAQAEFAEGVFPPNRSAFNDYGGPVMMGTHAKERVPAAVPNDSRDARQPGEQMGSRPLQPLWQGGMVGCGSGSQGVMAEGSMGQLDPGPEGAHHHHQMMQSCPSVDQTLPQAPHHPNQAPDLQAQHM